MEGLIQTFHIDVKLMIAQVVNFTIVLLVLYRFAYKPILKTLNDRTSLIEKGVKDAENAKTKLEEVTIKEKEILMAAKKESQEIIKNAEAIAVKDAERILFEAKDQSDKMLSEAKVQINQEKEKIMRDIKGEVAELVIAAAGKIISEKLNSEKDRELIEKVIAH